jgi:hypothetical protein
MKGTHREDSVFCWYVVPEFQSCCVCDVVHGLRTMGYIQFGAVIINIITSLIHHAITHMC